MDIFIVQEIRNLSLDDRDYKFLRERELHYWKKCWKCTVQIYEQIAANLALHKFTE